MGLIASRFEEVRSRSDWLNDDDDDGMRANTPSGVRVTKAAALGLTTVWRCVDLLSSAVSQAPKDVVVSVGGRSFPEYRNRPAWLTMPNPADPNYTGNDYFNEVALSMLFDGNYFTHVYPYVWDAQVLTVLDPARVVVRPGPLYDIKDEYGHVIRTVGPMEMLHGWWMRLPGMLRGIAPLEALRRGVGSAIAAEDFAGRFFGQGASLSFGVEVPGELDDPKKDRLRDALRRKYAGLNNSHAIGVLTGGAKFVTGLGITNEQAQMLDTRKFSVEDLCRPYGVPPGLAGSQEPGASSYASDEVKDKQFAERAVLPFANRIEKGHNRLLEVPANIADPSATIALKCNLDGVARVNVLTRMQSYGEGIRAGVLTPNYARGKEDLPPMDGGDLLYMQSQMVPIGMLGVPPVVVDTKRSNEEIEGEERRHVEFMAIAAREPQISVSVPVTTNPAPITVEGTQLTVQPAAPAEVRIEPQINVAPAAVTIEPAAVQVEVHVPPQRPVTKTITRNPKGDLTMTETPDGQ